MLSQDMRVIRKARQENAIAALRGKITTWIADNATWEGFFDRREMADLVNFVADTCADDVAGCSALFDDWDAFPEQPYVLVFGTPGSGDMDPDVYVMGWRPCDSPRCANGRLAEGTVIHDHGASWVAIRVVRGSIREDTFAPGSTHSSDGSVATSSRILSARETALLSAPVIHDVHHAPTGDETAITIHVYFPPLERQKIYEVVDGRLVANGEWVDEAKP